MGKAFELEYKYKKVEIHIIDFVGDVRNINGTPDLFSLSYNSNINDKGQYILATEAEINIYEDAYFNIDELKTVGETDILIKYFEYDELVWQGFALPDFFQTGIAKPRVLRIVATDRLGVLKDIVNTSVSNTPKEIIEECLLQTGLSLPVEIRNNNTYLETTTINRERIEGVSAYDVIRSFMVQFNSKIVQYKNRWWIVNKKLLEDGFFNQEIIDVGLVYLDGQREIKPTASEVSLYLEYGGSKRYPNNALFREWDGNKFLGWESKGGLTQRLNYKQIINYTKADGVSGYNANFGTEGSTPSLYCRYKMLSSNFENEGNYFNNQNGILSDSFPLRYRDGDTEVTLSIDFTTVSADIYLPFVVILKTPDGKFHAINDSGSVVPAYKEVGSNYEVDLTKVSPIRVAPAEADYLDAVQSTFNETFIINQNSLGATPESSQIEFRVYSVGYRVPNVGSTLAYLDVLFNSIQVIFNKSDVTGKGLIFKTKQGGEKFSKIRDTETTLFSDKINQGVNGYFYNYKYDDTSITNLPEEYLLEMTRQMADMFCSARDFYSLGGKFKVNPLARYRCGDKYFVFVGGVSHRETAEIDIEEIVSNSSLTRTDYIYTYFEDSKDNIKSIGTASGGGGVGGGSGGGGMTSSQLEALTNLSDWWKLDDEGNLYTEKNMYSQQGVSALGLGEGGSGGDGGEFDRLDKWADYDSTKAGWVLSAFLGKDLDTRVNALQSGSATNIEISGSGNAVTGVSKSGNLLTFAKESTFSLSTHNHDTIYKPIGYVPSWSEITNKPSTFTPSSHTHPISQIADLQTALDAKQPTILTGTTAQYYRGDKTWKTLNTTVVAEGTNLYFTNARVKAYGDTLYSLLDHIHTITQITGLQTALDNKEFTITKNTAFNKDFGTTTGTVAKGDDSRINNGQTSFGWGNHSSAGYALNSALTAHINKDDNPHNVTKAQVGLGNVDNESKAQMFSYANLTEETTIEEAYVAYAEIGHLYILNEMNVGNWKFKQVGTELHFLFNNVVKSRMLSDGTILAVGGITALSTE